MTQISHDGSSPIQPMRLSIYIRKRGYIFYSDKRKGGTYRIKICASRYARMQLSLGTARAMADDLINRYPQLLNVQVTTKDFFGQKNTIVTAVASLPASKIGPI